VIKLVGFFSHPKRKLKKLVKEGEYKQAVEFGESLVKKNPNDTDLHFIMGSIFYILKDAKSSLHYFDKVLDLKEYDSETLILKANVHVFLKEYDTAIDCCKKILDVDPENNDARSLLEQLKSN
jgi:tetratricopeptide (TPR) repeat protein